MAKVKIRYKRKNDNFSDGEIEKMADGELDWKDYYVNVTIDENTLLDNTSMNIKDLIDVKSLKNNSLQGKEILGIVGKAMEEAQEELKNKLYQALTISWWKKLWQKMIWLWEEITFKVVGIWRKWRKSEKGYQFDEEMDKYMKHLWREVL